MFRAVPRAQLEGRIDRSRTESGPVPTKYSPAFGYVHKEITKNVEFGEKTEVANRMKLEAVRERIKPDAVCTRGVTQCFSSVNRVKQLSRKYCNETFKRRLEAN